LIGGSLLRAVKVAFPEIALAAWGRRQEVVDRIVAEGRASFASTDMGEVVTGADLIVLALPVEFMAAAVEKFPPLTDDCGNPGGKVIVTDVGSVKASVVAELTPLVEERGGVFVGSHPMAGSEKSGMEFASAELFQEAPVIVVSASDEYQRETDAVARFWAGLGGFVSRMSADQHDRMVAAISHLPHVVASALARNVFQNQREALPYAAGGFRDTTRIASSAADMWSGILMENREAIREQLDRFAGEMEEWRSILQSGDREKLRRFLSQASEGRESV